MMTEDAKPDDAMESISGRVEQVTQEAVLVSAKESSRQDSGPESVGTVTDEHQAVDEVVDLPEEPPRPPPCRAVRPERGGVKEQSISDKNAHPEPCLLLLDTRRRSGFHGRV
jgi:hypothetical protein